MHPFGRVLRAHGLRGELYVQLFRPRRDKTSGRAQGSVLIGDREHALKSVRWVSPVAVVISCTGIPDRNASEAVQGAIVSIDELDPPELLADLADRLDGALAIDADNDAPIGRVLAIQDNGAQALLEIEHEKGETLVPCVDAFIAGSETREDGERVVRIRAIPGLFEGGEE